MVEETFGLKENLREEFDYRSIGIEEGDSDFPDCSLSRVYSISYRK